MTFQARLEASLGLRVVRVRRVDRALEFDEGRLRDLDRFVALLHRAVSCWATSEIGPRDVDAGGRRVTASRDDRIVDRPAEDEAEVPVGHVRQGAVVRRHRSARWRRGSARSEKVAVSNSPGGARRRSLASEPRRRERGLRLLQGRIAVQRLLQSDIEGGCWEKQRRLTDRVQHSIIEADRGCEDDPRGVQTATGTDTADVELRQVRFGACQLDRRVQPLLTAAAAMSRWTRARP